MTLTPVIMKAKIFSNPISASIENADRWFIQKLPKASYY